MANQLGGSEKSGANQLEENKGGQLIWGRVAYSKLSAASVG